MKHGAAESEARETGNFRELRMGRIAPGLLYRSAHPVDFLKKEGKPVITQKVLAAGIGTVLNLGDSLHEMRRSAESVLWYDAIVKAGNAIALGMDFHITSAYFCAKFADAVRFMLDHSAPFLVHCFAGIDRTGFFAMALEGFMDAELFDIIDDYVISICGNPVPPRSSGKYKKEAVYIHRILAAMNNGCSVNKENLRDAVIRYLKDKTGLRDEELLALDKKLSGTGNRPVQ